MRPEPTLIFSDNRGRYIPQAFGIFAGNFQVENITGEQLAVLTAGPDHPDSESVWCDVLDLATVVINGVQYDLFQDGDLWLIPQGMVWSEEKDFWVWPATEMEPCS